MGKKHREGFTLIELLVLMMVLALTLGLGVPAFTAMIANGRMSAASNQIVSSLHAGRAEALTRGRSVTLCASRDWAGAEPTCDGTASFLEGWIVFVDDNTNGSRDGGERILQVNAPVPASIGTEPRSGVDRNPPHYLSFRADGMLQEIPGLGAGFANVQLCDARGDRDTGGGRAAGRWITVTPAGRPTLIDTVAVLQGNRNPLGGC